MTGKFANRPLSIQMMGHKLFVVEFTTDFLFATDGLATEGISLMAMNVGQGQFIIKVINNDNEDYYLTKMAMYQVQ